MVPTSQNDGPSAGRAPLESPPQRLARLHQLYDESEINAIKSPLVQPFNNGMEPTAPFEWTVAHEAEGWQWLRADHGIVTVGGQQFEYAYTPLALREDAILTGSGSERGASTRLRSAPLCSSGTRSTRRAARKTTSKPSTAAATRRSTCSSAPGAQRKRELA